MSTVKRWEKGAVDPAEAVATIPNGAQVFVHGACATPDPLLRALAKRKELSGLRLFHLHLEGNLDYLLAEKERIRSTSLFLSPGLRNAVAAGDADFMSVFLSDIPDLITNGQIPIDVALVQLSPPDAHGFCSLGTSVDAARAAVDTCRILIAEINEQMPRTHGATVVPLADIDHFIHTDRPLLSHAEKAATDADRAIGELVANLVTDRSTIQCGIGSIPSAVLRCLRTKSDLGVHTEMFSDAMIDLVASGAVTNRYKNAFPGSIVTSFVAGSKRLFDFVHDNPRIQFHSCDITNNTARIAKNDRVVAINSAIEIDLTGQVCADSIGHRIFSGIGGQLDFIRGAALSKGGMPIIALPSTAQDGARSRIVSELQPGAGVVTTRGDVHWVVTEYGAVNLHGLTIRQRCERLISLAHPDFRAELRRESAQLGM